MVWTLLCVAINVGLAFIPANIAKNKGYSFGGFWCLSFFLSFLVGLIVAAILEDKHSDVPMKHCTQCGASMQRGSAFCSACGAEAPPHEEVHSDVSEPPQQHRFVTHYLGLVILGVMLLMALSMGSMASKLFFSPTNLANILRAMIPYSLLALGVLVSARSKGLDLSLGSVMVFGSGIAALIATQGSLASGIIIGLLACAAVGLINGAATVYLKVPSLIPTVLMAVILGRVNIVITQGRPILLKETIQTVLPGGWPIGLITVLPFAIIVVLVLFNLTKLRRPLDKLSAADMRKPVYMLSYMVGSILAGMAGIYLMLQIRVALTVQGFNNIAIIVLIFGVIMSTRFTNKPALSVVIALAGVVVYEFLWNAMILSMISPYISLILTALIAVIFVVISIFARKNTWKRMLRFK